MCTVNPYWEAEARLSSSGMRFNFSSNQVQKGIDHLTVIHLDSHSPQLMRYDIGSQLVVGRSFNFHHRSLWT